MPSATASQRPSAAGAIDNYYLDDDFEDPFASPEPDTGGAKSKDAAEGLGIDEEVSVQKRARAPRVKLDDSRLLSNQGISKLRKRAKDLRLKGRGHEFSDAARLLSFYQLWLDDLFPKAKFLDALAMVEKAGHKTAMHKARVDLINEDKPGRANDDDVIEAEDHGQEAREPAESDPRPDAALDGNSKTSESEPLDTAEEGQQPDEDELDALMAEAMVPSISRDPSARRVVATKPAPQTTTSGELDDDYLELLMAEAETHSAALPLRHEQTPRVQESFADEEAAMAEMGGFYEG